MRISRIFTQAILQADQLIVLDEKTSHYLSKVLRLKVAAQLIVFNGDGMQYPSVIAAIEKKSVTILTGAGQLINNESPLHTHLGIALSKGDRIETVMQKATELGVSEITPLISDRTEVKLNADRAEKKQQHWQQILISACEQCGRNRIPQLHPLQSVNSWASQVVADKKLVLHHRTDKKLEANEAISSVALLIGPEGGLSASEIAFAEQQKFSALRLGPRVLRTETAPLVALSLLQHIWGDL